jgi:hypothetical protein
MVQCPKCGSDESSAVASEGVAMTFAKDRKCTRCGVVWRPPCPIWAGWLSVLLGLGILGVGAWVGLGQGVAEDLKHRAAIWLIVSTGGIVLGYGFAVVTGRAGKLQIITPPGEGDDEGKK